jgi:hypothetical protein
MNKLSKEPQGNEANTLLPAVIYNEVINSTEYKKYCKVYNVKIKESEKEVAMYLIWKSFGCSL